MGCVCLSEIKRADIQSINKLDDMVNLFKELGFTKYYQEDEKVVSIQISDYPEFIKLIQIKTLDDVKRQHKFLNSDVEYLSLVTNDFENFVFVKKEFTALETVKFYRFKFTKSNVSNTTLKKLNCLRFDDCDSFQTLFDKREVVKQFYDEFKMYRNLLIDNIYGIEDKKEKVQYAQVLFDRLIFLYFIQKKGLLDSNKQYLSELFQACKGEFYKKYLWLLFFHCLNKEPADETKERIVDGINFGKIPFLNGGLFSKLDIETENVSISNETFKEILSFLDRWNWYVDERDDYGEEKSINPEILGHIFERTVNQKKETGSYYTPEDITKYISENTIYSYCLDRVNDCFNKKYTNISKIFNQNDEKEINYLYHNIIKNISILDNACGSGAFLIAAQNVLIELYKKCIHILANSDKELSDEITKYNSYHARKLSSKFDDSHEWIYYIKRSTITNNLYDVDNAKEAIEIAKLRLWLSLIADASDNILDIEPLPRIEYNLQCGNSLIGYISKYQISNERLGKVTHKKSRNKKMAVRNLFLPQVSLVNYSEEHINSNDSIDVLVSDFSNANFVSSHDTKGLESTSEQICIDNYQEDAIFRLCSERDLLIEEYRNTDSLNEAEILKLKIERITIENNQVLNEKLFSEIKDLNISKEEFLDFKPFHWIMNFSTVFNSGGFDIIIGNPPYGDLLPDQLSKQEKYIMKDYLTKDAKEISANFIERQIKLLKRNGYLGNITTGAIIINERTTPAHDIIRKNMSKSYISFFNTRPSKIFDGVEIRVSIILGKKDLPLSQGNIYTTDAVKFTAEQRSELLNRISFENTEGLLLGDRIGSLNGNGIALPKLGYKETRNIMLKLKNCSEKNLFKDILVNKSKYKLEYRKSGGYWLNALPNMPCLSSCIGALFFESNIERDFCIIVINSSLFYLYWSTYSDLRHFQKSLLEKFPSVPIKILHNYQEAISDLKDRVTKCMLESFVSDKGRNGEFTPCKCKHIIDEIDVLLGKIYGLTDEEVKFIQNYDKHIRPTCADIFE